MLEASLCSQWLLRFRPPWPSPNDNLTRPCVNWNERVFNDHIEVQCTAVDTATVHVDTLFIIVTGTRMSSELTYVGWGYLWCI